MKQEIKQPAEYDWLPITCTLCKGLGHDKQQCMKKFAATKKIWVPKQPIKAKPREEFPVAVDQEDGFVQAAKFSKTQSIQLKPIITVNRVQALDEVTWEDGHAVRVYDVQEEQEVAKVQGVTIPP